jgi:hypothetical protein
MTAIYITDGYRDAPPRNDRRAVLEHELRRLKALHWADPGDAEMRARIATLEHELAALDQAGGAS